MGPDRGWDSGADGCTNQEERLVENRLSPNLSQKQGTLPCPWGSPESGPLDCEIPFHQVSGGERAAVYRNLLHASGSSCVAHVTRWSRWILMVGIRVPVGESVLC